MQKTQETRVRSLGLEDPLKKEMATYSSTLAWKIPWEEKLGGLQSMGSQRAGLDRVCMHLILRKGSLSRTYKELLQLNNHSNNHHLLLKWAMDLTRHFSQEDIQMTNEHMKKMLTIIIYQGNASQNHSKIIPYTHEDGYCQKKPLENNNCWPGYGKIRTLVHCWWENKIV